MTSSLLWLQLFFPYVTNWDITLSFPGASFSLRSHWQQENVKVASYKQEEKKKKIRKNILRNIKIFSKQFFPLLFWIFINMTVSKVKPISCFYSDDATFQRGDKSDIGLTMTSSVLLILVVGRTMAPDNAHILIPITCEYIAKRTLQMYGDGRVP